MPLIRVELFDYRITEETSAALIEKLTDALCEATHPGLRDHTWVIVEGHNPKNWGLGGKPWPVGDLPGNDVARRFEGADQGAGLSFFIGRFPPGAGPRLHRHDYEETFVIDGGGATFTVDGEAIEAGAGQVVIVPAGAAHSFVSGEDGFRFLSLQPVARMAQEWLEE